MERAVRGGRVSRHLTDAADYEGYLAKLASNPRLQGFESAEGKMVLDGWLRNSIVRMGKQGLQRTGSLMKFLRPLTVATFRSGLPKLDWFFRKTDEVIYQSLLQAIDKNGNLNDQGEIKKELKRIFVESFGFGVDMRDNFAASIAPIYNEELAAQVDINEILQLRFLEGFDIGSDPETRHFIARDEAVPQATSAIGIDLLSLLLKFGAGGEKEKWSSSELVSAATALIAIRLFQLPLILAKACEDVILDDHPRDFHDFKSHASLEIYCDLTDDVNGLSRRLSQRCVLRDRAIHRQFFIDRVTLRTALEIAQLVPKYASLNSLNATQQLRELGVVIRDPDLEIPCHIKFIDVKRQILGIPENKDYENYFEELETREISWLEKLVEMQLAAQTDQALIQQNKWFWSTGGLVSGGKHGMESYALLRGNAFKPNWAYAPSNELLTTLLILIFVDTDLKQPPSSRLPLGEVLKRLRDRFGILISQPPENMNTAENRKAAAENLESFVRKLKQIGCYHGLTDDLNAQYVERPRVK